MKKLDIDFIKDLFTSMAKDGDISDSNIKSSAYRTTKIKKWVSTEVGRLLFCLWQIYESRLQMAN